MITSPYEYECSVCQRTIDERIETVWYKLEGWTKEREQGGPNRVALRRPLDVFMCDPCMKKALAGVHAAQAELFA